MFWLTYSLTQRMPWLTRAYGAKRMLVAALLSFPAAMALWGEKPVRVQTAPPVKAQPQTFRDRKYGVRFRVPPGWNVSRKDREVSTFRLDARSAGERAKMRAVVSLDFNPFPNSTLSGALVYFSVEPHLTDHECAKQAGNLLAETRDVQNIGGMSFAHGHDEHGGICVEARDEVYTAFRKGSCYRFDLAMNTFCSVSSGARELTERQMREVQERMVGILSSVALDWEKSGPQPVSVPAMTSGPKQIEPKLIPRVPALGAGAM